MQLSGRKLYVLTVLSSITLLLWGCHGAFDADNGGNSSVTQPILVSGQVVDQADSQPLANAFVEITTPALYQQSTTTDSTGAYTFTVDAAQSVDLNIKATKANYTPVTQQLTVSPGSDFPETNLALTSTSDSGGDDGTVGGEPAGAAAIILTGNPVAAINIAETGDVVSSPFTFQVQDSAGRALNSKKSVEVQFNLVSSPGGGEDVVPATATTNADGKVTTTLFSGNRAGEVKLQALVKRPDEGLTIKSSPVLIAIHGGFPDKDHFSIAPEKHNFEGYSLNNNRDGIAVVLGDKFSNPVKPGTVVYFESTGGIITGSGTTDEDGIINVDLISGDPRPADGKVTVTASTVNENNVRIQKQLDMIFSSSNALINASPETFNLPPNGGATFDYTVTDKNGNPMAAGTQISISAGQGIEISGDTNLTLGDKLQPGPGATEFSFSIRDTDNESNEQADLTIQITVTSPSGNTTTYSGIQGVRSKVGGSKGGNHF